MDPIKAYLSGSVPVDPKEAKKIDSKVARYILRDGNLYKREFLLPLIKGLTVKDTNYILREVHEGFLHLAYAYETSLSNSIPVKILDAPSI